MKLKDAIVYVLLALMLVFAWLWMRGGKDPVLTPDKGERERDSMDIVNSIKAELAAKKLAGADSVDRSADTIEAHMLPPETLYLKYHEKALSADVAHMRWFMGQRPRDTSATR